MLPALPRKWVAYVFRDPITKQFSARREYTHLIAAVGTGPVIPRVDPPSTESYPLLATSGNKRAIS